MGKGFFSISKLKSNKPTDVHAPKCGLCGLYKKCPNPKIQTTGNGRKGILIVGDYPSQVEQKPFTDEAGQHLRKILKQINIDLDKDCWKTYALRCQHKEKKAKTKQNIVFCRANLFNTIKDLSPKVIILLGSEAVRSLIGRIWKEDIGPITRWTGWQIPYPKQRAWICPTWNHRELLNSSTNKRQINNPALELLFKRHIENAFTIKKPPVDFDYKSKIKVIVSPKQAAKEIKNIQEQGIDSAFDWETNCIKPETPGAKIICCAVSNGQNTIAFPWHGKAKNAMLRLLTSDIWKIAANQKFEDRWCNIHAVNVKNWKHCTMLGAHVLDNRQLVTSLKFQAFVRFGIPSYDDHIKSYMASGKNKLNRLVEIDIKDLLLYNGMDGLITWNLAQVQIDELNND